MRLTVPRGVISVMPQAWTTWRPWSRSKRSIIEGGAAAPPEMISLRRDRSQVPAGALSSASNRLSQMVGTPAVLVTPSPAIRSSKLTASRCGPGKTCLAPIMVQVKGRPQAFTWNMGTTGSTTSEKDAPSASGRALTREWSTSARCE